MNDPDDPTTAAGRRLAGIVALVFASAMHLVVGFFTLASGLLAPPWAVVLLVGIWTAFAVLLVRLAHRQPLLTLLVPFAMAAVLWLVLTIGDVWLGWTA